jgi:hypothetical protein
MRNISGYGASMRSFFGLSLWVLGLVFLVAMGACAWAAVVTAPAITAVGVVALLGAVIPSTKEEKEMIMKNIAATKKSPKLVKASEVNDGVTATPQTPRKAFQVFEVAWVSFLAPIFGLDPKFVTRLAEINAQPMGRSRQQLAMQWSADLGRTPQGSSALRCLFLMSRIEASLSEGWRWGSFLLASRTLRSFFFGPNGPLKPRYAASGSTTTTLSGYMSPLGKVYRQCLNLSREVMQWANTNPEAARLALADFSANSPFLAHICSDKSNPTPLSTRIYFHLSGVDSVLRYMENGEAINSSEDSIESLAAAAMTTRQPAAIRGYMETLSKVLQYMVDPSDAQLELCEEVINHAGQHGLRTDNTTAALIRAVDEFYSDESGEDSDTTPTPGDEIASKINSGVTA